MTLCATVTLPILLITGYCGMNFDNLPSIHYKYGVLRAPGMMTALAVMLLLLFRKTGWC
jgi:magnesium transporter